MGRVLWLFHNLICTSLILLTGTLLLINLKMYIGFSLLTFIALELFFSLPLIASAVFRKDFKLTAFTYPIFYFLLSAANGDDAAADESDLPLSAALYVFLAITSYIAFLLTVFTMAWYPPAFLLIYCISTNLFLNALPEEK